jgi:hypothetical protein
MSSDQDHGVEVETDSIRSALAPTRALRQALGVVAVSAAVTLAVLIIGVRYPALSPESASEVAAAMTNRNMGVHMRSPVLPWTTPVTEGR